MSVSIEKYLPEAVFLHVLGYVGPLDTLVSTATCKYFKELGNRDPLWKEFYKKDFLTQVENTNEIQYKKIYLSSFKNKIKYLHLWLKTFEYPNADQIDAEHQTLNKIKEELCDRLFDAYYVMMQQDYSKVGRILAIHNTGDFQGLPKNFPFEQIEQEHCEVVTRLLNLAIEKNKKLEICFDEFVVDRVLQPMQVTILSNVLESLTAPIPLSFTDVSFKNLFFLFPLIGAGKISSLTFWNSNYINEEEKLGLINRAKMSDSKLISLEINGEKRI